MFDQLVEAGDRVFGIARTFTEAQRRLAATEPDRVQLCNMDLADTARIGTATMRDFFDPVADAPVALVLNAAVVSPLGAVGAVPAGEMARAVAINLTSTMVLTNTFLAARPSRAPTRIVFVSTRAARIAKAGQATYCATKAGAEMFFESVAREASADSRIEVAMVGPPAMDTGMQATIRAAVGLPDREHFAGRYERGELSDPSEIAEKIIAEHLGD